MLPALLPLCTDHAVQQDGQEFMKLFLTLLEARFSQQEELRDIIQARPAISVHSTAKHQSSKACQHSVASVCAAAGTTEPLPCATRLQALFRGQSGYLTLCQTCCKQSGKRQAASLCILLMRRRGTLEMIINVNNSLNRCIATTSLFHVPLLFVAMCLQRAAPAATTSTRWTCRSRATAHYRVRPPPKQLELAMACTGRCMRWAVHGHVCPRS